MSNAAHLKPTHKAIQQYYQALQSYAEHQVEHEGALETAFQRLLADTARTHGWTLIPKQKYVAGKHHLYPDGTLRDDFTLPRGYWEAKDTHDVLDAEITATSSSSSASTTATSLFPPPLWERARVGGRGDANHHPHPNPPPSRGREQNAQRVGTVAQSTV